MRSLTEADVQNLTETELRGKIREIESRIEEIGNRLREETSDEETNQRLRPLFRSLSVLYAAMSTRYANVSA